MIRHVVLIFVVLFWTGYVSAADFTVHGAVKNETAYFVSGDRRFDKIQNRIDIKPEGILSDRWEFRGRVLGWYDAAMDVESTNVVDLRAGIKQHYRSFTRSKEAYLLYGGDDFDFRIGQQQIVWGKTDGIRMLDIINPLDLREFILDDFLDSRIGLWSVRLNYYAEIGGSEHELEFIIIPDARVTKLAPVGSRWGMPSVAAVSMAPEKPNWAAGNTEFGLAWRANISGWDLSLNYFYGWKDNPNLFKQLNGGILTTQSRHLRMHTAGGSFANAFGAFVIRGEMAVNLGEGIDTTGVSFSTSVMRRTTLNGALAVDYTKSNWTIAVQVFGRHVLNEPQKNPLTTPSSDFATLRVATDYMNEKLKPEVLLLTDLDEGAILLRPKVSYEFSDQWLGRLGADILVGSGGSFGRFAANDRIYSEIEWSF